MFSHEGIIVEKPLSFDLPVFIPGEDISAFRYKVVFVYGYIFAFARHYIIETKDFQNNVFQVKLSSIYNIRRKAYFNAWAGIFNQLWKHYFSNMLNYYTDMYTIGQMFELAGVKFDTDGISWDKNSKLLWKEIALSNYRTYFMIYHIDNISQRKSCSFANDWNAYILQCLLKSIVQQHKKAAQALN